MEHETAEKTLSAERYLLNEMDAEERSAFESHFFNCPICAERVRDGAAFGDNAKRVLQEERFAAKARGDRFSLFQWLRPAVLIPVFASLCLAAIVVYQNVVTLPAFRAPRVLSTVVLAPLSRQRTPVVTIDSGKPLFNVNFTVDAPRVYPKYSCEFRDSRGGLVLAVDCGGQTVSSFTLSLLLPASKFSDGTYELTLRSDNPAGFAERYTFAIQRGHIEATS